MSETARSAPAAMALAALSHDLMAAVDRDGRIAWANPSWRRLLGWAPDELAGTRLEELVDDPKAARTLLRGGEAVLAFATRSGGKRRVAVAAAVEDGVTYLCGRDATQTEELEHELRAAEDRFRVVTEATSDAIAVADGRGRITFANRATTVIFGWHPHELLGQPFTILVPERFRDGWAQRLEHFLATGEAELLGRTIEVLGMRRDGEEFPMEASLGAWERGERRAFTGIMRDVGERNATLRELSLAQARYHAVVANLPNVIVTLFDTDERMLVMEGGQMGPRGLVPEEFQGRTFAEAIPQEAQEAIGPHLRAALAGEERELTFSAAGIAFEIHIAPLRADDERIIGAVSVARDVTALREAQQRLEERALELERSNAELAEFAYVASHDLSEPLRTITGYLQLLQRRFGASLSGGADEYVSAAIDSAGRLRHLIDDLLTYSRAGRSERPAEPVDLADVVADIAAHVAAGREPAPVIDAGELPVVPGEARQLSQLLQNLISNAVKFVAPGTVPHVRVSAERDGDAWRVAVEDNGIGIAPEQAERIFGMFQRLHARDDYPGTGIGLAIARKVVERHGGRIWAEPRAEGGTRMVFTLPAQAGRSSP
jgi:PAS domain S-box-containing protein